MRGIWMLCFAIPVALGAPTWNSQNSQPWNQPAANSNQQHPWPMPGAAQQTSSQALNPWQGQQPQQAVPSVQNVWNSAWQQPSVTSNGINASVANTNGVPLNNAIWQNSGSNGNGNSWQSTNSAAGNSWQGTQNTVNQPATSQNMGQWPTVSQPRVNTNTNTGAGQPWQQSSTGSNGNSWQQAGTGNNGNSNTWPQPASSQPTTNTWSQNTNNQWQQNNDQWPQQTPQTNNQQPTNNNQWNNNGNQWQHNGDVWQQPAENQWQPNNNNQQWSNNQNQNQQQGSWNAAWQPNPNPWVMNTMPTTATPTTTPVVTTTSTRATTTHPATTTTTPSPVNPTTSHAPTVQPTMKMPKFAHHLYFPQNKCKGGTRRAVTTNFDAFEVCDNGEWVFMLCAPGTWFDTEFMECTDGYSLAPSWPLTDEIMMSIVNGTSGMLGTTSSPPVSTTMNTMTNMMNVYSNPNVQQQGMNENLGSGSMPQIAPSMMVMNGLNPQQGMNHYGSEGMPQTAPSMMAMIPQGMNQNQGSGNMPMPQNIVPTMMTIAGGMMVGSAGYQDPNLWMNDVRELIIVSIEKCKVGLTREDQDPNNYQECILNPTGHTLWIRRRCAPGSLFSPWTKNCGKYNVWYNNTNIWLGEIATTHAPNSTTMVGGNVGSNSAMNGVTMNSGNGMNGAAMNGGLNMGAGMTGGNSMGYLHTSGGSQGVAMNGNVQKQLLTATNDLQPWLQQNGGWPKDERFTITLDLDKIGQYRNKK